MHMKDLLPTPSLLLIVTSFTLIHIPNISGQDQLFDTCRKPLSCGNLTLTYPFWGGDRPESCGYPDFNLSCQGNIAQFAVGPVAYWILSVDASAHTLTVARADLVVTLCPRYLHNTTLDFNILSYPNDITNITLFYNCKVPATIPQGLNQFPCNVNGSTQTTSFFMISAGSSTAQIEQQASAVCTDNIRVPITNESAASGLLTSTTALGTAFLAGFPLQYEANNTACTDCTNSGGQCGYNTRNNSFACYQQNGNAAKEISLGLRLAPLYTGSCPLWIPTLTVAREDLWADNCPQYLHNTTLNFNIFSYPNNIANITLLYNCSPPPGFPQQPSQFACTVNRTTPTASFFLTNGAPNSSLSQQPIPNTCTGAIIVPIDQASLPGLITNGTAGLRAALAAGFPLQYEANNTECTNCTNSGGQCVYDTGSNSFACYHQNGNGREHGLNLVTGLLTAVAGMTLLGGIFYCLLKRCSWWEALIYWKSDKGNNQQVEAFMRNYGSIAPKLYKYSEIKKMTNSFAKKLGHGGYGSVYRGKLSDGRLVAVKVLNVDKGNGEEFINEVASISRTSHVNVVNLLGFYYDRSKRALIYEFMPNGSLDRFIYQKQSSRDTTTDCPLEWKTLYEIAVGTARGLEYLHSGCNTRIVHFDIKPHNILLDKDFCPKISDFGLARICRQKQSILSTIGARGTAGYIAPEVFCRNFGGISHKSDVYSYGMVLLEIVGLRRKIGADSEQTSERYFPNWIYEQLELGKDLEVQGVMNEEEEETSRKMILVGLWCIQTHPADRPSMSKVVEMLEGSLEHLKIPPKPFSDSPPMARESTQESWTSSISIS